MVCVSHPHRSPTASFGSVIFPEHRGGWSPPVIMFTKNGEKVMINDELKTEIRNAIREIIKEDPDGTIEKKVEKILYGDEK